MDEIMVVPTALGAAFNGVRAGDPQCRDAVATVASYLGRAPRPCPTLRYESATDDDPAAHAGAESDADQRVASPSRAEPGVAQRERAGVVDDGDRESPDRRPAGRAAACHTTGPAG